MTITNIFLSKQTNKTPAYLQNHNNHIDLKADKDYYKYI